MSKGAAFLELVTGKLKEQLSRVHEEIEQVKRDIHGMNDYYWENYTEMDEYGYENYDNRQALKLQVDANEENRKQRRRLEKMLDAPFFGSVTFRFEDEEDEEPETFYIGIGNFAERAGDVPLIYDWRAPVSSLFYDYDRGPASYEAPGGVMRGEVTEKWQYKIRGGHMVYEFESDCKIDDEILKQELGKHGDVKLKNIVRTIQKEQNAIIRNTKDQVMIIQGAAGSGKTSIALHRIAYLLYHDRKRLTSANVLVLSPNSVFADYISHILPELGEENIREMSLDIFAYHELRDTVNDCEDRYHQIERQIRMEQECLSGRRRRVQLERVQERYHYKQSKRFAADLEGFLVELEDRLVDFRDITYKKMTMNGDEERMLFYGKFADIPLLSRMDAVRERFVDEYETLYGDLTEEEQLLIQEKFSRLYVTTDLYRIYNWFLKEKNLPGLPSAAPEKRYLRYEDVYPLLYLKYRLYEVRAHGNVRHLVIDEMQDYNYLQYEILQHLFPCAKTILGDRAQTVDQPRGDVLSFLPKIVGRDARVIELNRSYRSTAEIAAYAAAINPVDGIEYLERHGKPVEEICVGELPKKASEVFEDGAAGDAERMAEHILTRVKTAEGGYETAAVLTLTEAEAYRLYELLKDRRPDVSLLDRDTSSFRKGLVITTYYLAKGLEFDQVFAAKADPRLSMYRQYRYLCATRALHELYVYL